MIEERSSEDQPSTNIINDGGKVDPGRLESIYEQSLAQDGPVTVVFTMSRDLDKRLDRYLVDRIPWMSDQAPELDCGSGHTERACPQVVDACRRDDVIDHVPPPRARHCPPRRFRWTSFMRMTTSSSSTSRMTSSPPSSDMVRHFDQWTGPAFPASIQWQYRAGTTLLESSIA